ncbi:hypothetical protein PG989_006209 [Apiospora arundinis]|uniref:Zn(2)-C6 fungal-type domain-containing protein n=1 Tax=Apiospora arundinis TaxID=335852 RepID=A0ABR2IW26_9PEZI
MYTPQQKTQTRTPLPTQRPNPPAQQEPSDVQRIYDAMTTGERDDLQKIEQSRKSDRGLQLLVFASELVSRLDSSETQPATTTAPKRKVTTPPYGPKAYLEGTEYGGGPSSINPRQKKLVPGSTSDPETVSAPATPLPPPQPQVARLAKREHQRERKDAKAGTGKDKGGRHTTENELKLAAKIEAEGEKAEVPCQRCTHKPGGCMMLEGHARCSRCVRSKGKCLAPGEKREPKEVKKEDEMTKSDRPQQEPKQRLWQKRGMSNLDRSSPAPHPDAVPFRSSRSPRYQRPSGRQTYGQMMQRLTDWNTIFPPPTPRPAAVPDRRTGDSGSGRILDEQHFFQPEQGTARGSETPDQKNFSKSDQLDPQLGTRP